MVYLNCPQKYCIPVFSTFFVSENMFPKVTKKSIAFKNFVIKNNGKDCWFYTKSKEIVCFEKITEELNGIPKIHGKHILFKADSYDDPFPSSYINEYSSDGLLSGDKTWNVEDIFCKMWCFVELNDTKRFAPLLHTFLN